MCIRDRSTGAGHGPRGHLPGPAWFAVSHSGNVVFTEQPVTPNLRANRATFRQFGHTSPRDTKATRHFAAGHGQGIVGSRCKRSPIWPITKPDLIGIGRNRQLMSHLVSDRDPSPKGVSGHFANFLKCICLSDASRQVRKANHPSSGIEISVDAERIVSFENLLQCRHIWPPFFQTIFPNQSTRTCQCSSLPGQNLLQVNALDVSAMPRNGEWYITFTYINEMRSLRPIQCPSQIVENDLHL